MSSINIIVIGRSSVIGVLLEVRCDWGTIVVLWNAMHAFTAKSLFFYFITTKYFINKCWINLVLPPLQKNRCIDNINAAKRALGLVRKWRHHFGGAGGVCQIMTDDDIGGRGVSQKMTWWQRARGVSQMMTWWQGGQRNHPKKNAPKFFFFFFAGKSCHFFYVLLKMMPFLPQLLKVFNGQTFLHVFVCQYHSVLLQYVSVIFKLFYIQNICWF